jgi:SAM-dependent methyltransferase
MRIDLKAMQADFHATQRGKESRHSVEARASASVWQYDFLTLNSLSESIQELLSKVPEARPGALALDLGSYRSPYRSLVEARGYELKTLDIVPDYGADFVGTAEDTQLGDATFDLVLCTQVLEHCPSPWRVMAEIHRILSSGGHVIVSVPHVWFYHPHPGDYWRFTQEGITTLCDQSGMRVLELVSQGGTVLSAVQILNFLMYGVLGRWGAPLYALNNVIGRKVDGWVPNSLFCVNFACLATRP